MPSLNIHARNVQFIPLAIVVAVVLAFIVSFLVNNNRILPGVSINGVPVGGLTREAAQYQLDQTLTQYQGKELLVEYNKTTLRVPVRGLKVTSAENAVEEAYTYGRTGSLGDQLHARLRSLTARPTKVTGFSYDYSALTPYIQKVDSDVAQPVANATLGFSNGQVEVSSSKPGRRLDVGRLTQLVEQRLGSSSNGKIQAPIYLVKATVDEDTLAGAKQQASTLASSPLTVTAGSMNQVIDQATILSWVNVTALGHRTDMAVGPLGGFYPPIVEESVNLSVDPQRVQSFVDKLSKQISKEPKNAELGFAGDKVVVEVAGVDGVTLDVPKAAVQIEQALKQAGDNRTVALQATVVKPAVHEGNLGQLGIKELISEGVSYFPGSAPERMQNVRVGQALYDGVLLKPGEVFSFGKILGDVGPQTGYAPSKVILGDRQELQYGGGLCQVSSTAFRAALNAGLPILERVNHSFAVSYYTEPYGVPGVDATIYYPQVDFKFKNDTPNYILIQTIMQGTTLKFQFYGTKTKEGKIRGPQFISGDSNPENPSRTVFYRDIIVDGKVTKTDTFYTNYKSSKDFPNKPQFN